MKLFCTGLRRWEHHSEFRRTVGAAPFAIPRRRIVASFSWLFVVGCALIMHGTEERLWTEGPAVPWVSQPQYLLGRVRSGTSQADFRSTQGMSSQRRLATRCRWIAWLNLLRWGALAGLIAFMVAAAVTKETSWFLPAGLSVGVFLVALLIFAIEAPRVRCLGCRATLLLPMRCATHPAAKRFAGSHTLRCTLALAANHGPIHCPYCGMRFQVGKSAHESKSFHRSRGVTDGRTEKDEWDLDHRSK